MNSILIVDDDPNNFEVIEALLFKEGYNLSYASSGLQALEALELNLPDVILLDVMMPDIDGIEVCHQIKSDSRWQHIPVIMITALNSKENLARCLNAGADDFLGKPVSGIELRARVRSMLRIKRQYEALQSTLQLREDMSQMIVHDLRNPLTNIFIACELLLRAELPEKQQKRVEQIVIAGQRLRSLTDDLLVVAKMESGKMALKRDKVDLCQMAAAVVLDFAGAATEKNIRLVSQFSEQGIRSQVDVSLIRRVFDNLLSNALKFSPPGSQVTVEVNYLDPLIPKACIRIYDQGHGVEAELKQRIFEKYEVGHLISGVSQIGLGLAFCKMAVEAHGGRILVEDNLPQGSVFIVEI